MTVGGGHGLRSEDRRRWHRIKLAVPVQVSRDAAESKEEVCSNTGLSRDISTGGIYVIIEAERGAFVPGEMLTVSISIPWEARRLFPFSQIVGSCRVVRAERLPVASPGKQQGLALSFCEDAIKLGTTMTPR